MVHAKANSMIRKAEAQRFIIRRMNKNETITFICSMPKVFHACGRISTVNLLVEASVQAANSV
jgi:hypothetical protein